MKTRKWIFILSAVIAGAFVFSSCEKNSNSPGVITGDDEITARDNTLMENLLDDAMDAADQATMLVDAWIFDNDGNTLKSASGVVVSDSCPTITVDRPDSTRWPKVITIDYGELCTGFFGHTRSGKIVITITGRYMKPGSERTIELVDYYCNGIHVEGTRTVKNEGRNADGNLSFRVELSGGKISKSDTVFMTRDFVRYREWVAGEDTRNRWDDVFFITGEASGVNFRGHTYHKVITSPLEWARSCRFIKSGTVSITIDDRPPVILDYGDGTCDNLATLTRGDQTKEIELGYHHNKCGKCGR